MFLQNNNNIIVSKTRRAVAFMFFKSEWAKFENKEQSKI